MRNLFSLLLGVAAVASAQSSLYGPNGLHFVPGGLPASGPRYNLSLGGSLDQPTQGHASVGGRLFEDRFEWSVSNTYRLVDGDSGGWNPSTKYPSLSVKWILDSEIRGRQSWGYAAGFSLPYGAYAAAGWRLKLPVASPEIHLGLGTPVRTAYAFGGMAIDLCDLEGNPLPIRLAIDGALAGATGTLGRADEGFVSVGVTTRIGRNLTLQTIHRRDRKYLADNDHQNTSGTSYLRLQWSFDGPKTAPKAGNQP